jgi:hypothetical protein
LSAFIFDLALILNVALARGTKQLFARVHQSTTDHQNHIWMQDLRHGFGIVSLNRGLIGCVETGHGSAIVLWRRMPSANRKQRGQCTSSGARGFCVHRLLQIQWSKLAKTPSELLAIFGL